MEKNNKESKESGIGDSCDHCHGFMGHNHGYHKYFVLRWVLGVVILVIVFWLGIKIGEFKGYLASGMGGYGYGHHRGMMYNSGFYPANMMQYWGIPAVDSSSNATDNTTTATPKTTTPKK